MPSRVGAVLTVKNKNGNKKMKKEYEKIQLMIVTFDADDVCTMSIMSGEVDGDETKYPVPGGWVAGAQ